MSTWCWGVGTTNPPHPEIHSDGPTGPSDGPTDHLDGPTGPSYHETIQWSSGTGGITGSTYV